VRGVELPCYVFERAQNIGRRVEEEKKTTGGGSTTLALGLNHYFLHHIIASVTMISSTSERATQLLPEILEYMD
jgi:hypothetical protein